MLQARVESSDQRSPPQDAPCPAMKQPRDCSTGPYSAPARKHHNLHSLQECRRLGHYAGNLTDRLTEDARPHNMMVPPIQPFPRRMTYLRRVRGQVLRKTAWNDRKNNGSCRWEQHTGVAFAFHQQAGRLLQSTRTAPLCSSTPAASLQ